jgi:glycerol-3-phosphate dehydrogenase
VVKDAVFARAQSGRHVIVSPWMGRSFVGPTDTPDPEQPDEVRVEAADVDELLTTVNDTMAADQAPLTLDDVQAVTVGIRPLVMQDGRDSYSASRRHELYDHAKSGVARLWSIGGGKWTTGRALAEDLLDELEAAPDLAGAPWRRFDSRRAPASAAFAWAEDAEPYLAAAAARRPELGLDPDVRLHLARLYGTEHERVLDLVARDPSLGVRLSQRPGCCDIGAQVVFAVTDEAARTLADIVDRRLVLGTLGPVTAAELDRVAALAGPALGWDAERSWAESRAELERRTALEARWRRAG